jgi:hypothetical protein
LPVSVDAGRTSALLLATDEGGNWPVPRASLALSAKEGRWRRRSTRLLVVHSGHVSDVAVDARVDKQERGEPPQAPRTFATLTRGS